VRLIDGVKDKDTVVEIEGDEVLVGDGSERQYLGDISPGVMISASILDVPLNESNQESCVDTFIAFGSNQLVRSDVLRSTPNSYIIRLLHNETISSQCVD